MKLAIIIPTLNEIDSLPLLFDELKSNIKQIEEKGYFVEVTIVDDNSDDGTQYFVKKYAETSQFKIKLIERKERGLATAVIRGFIETNAEIICVMDADLSHPPALIPQMVKNAKNKKRGFNPCFLLYVLTYLAQIILVSIYLKSVNPHIKTNFSSQN